MEPTPPCNLPFIEPNFRSKKCGNVHSLKTKHDPFPQKPKSYLHFKHRCLIPGITALPLWLSPFQMKKKFCGFLLHATQPHHALLPWIRSLFQLFAGEGEKKDAHKKKNNKMGENYYLIPSTRWVQQQSQLARLLLLASITGYVPISQVSSSHEACVVEFIA
jgi:hypothetical protein